MRPNWALLICQACDKSVMKGPYFTTVGLLVTLLHFSQQATAGGTLNFVNLYSAVTLSNEDDTKSSSISTDGGFPFGTGTIYSVYVRKRSPCACVHGMFSVL
jgi:hypothetical protein